jgi:hypothetical protein
MEPDGIKAFCPTCAKDYVFYGDAGALDPKARRASDGRWARPCFACSFRTSRWDALWIPAFVLVVMSFPLLWMLWSNVIGPLVFLSPVAFALWRRVRRVLGRGAARGAEGPGVAPHPD